MWMKQDLGTIFLPIDENMGTNLQALYSLSASVPARPISEGAAPCPIYMRRPNLKKKFFFYFYKM